MICKVANCRHPTTHVTKGHRCGRCKNFGHGQLECRQAHMIQRLETEDQELGDANRCLFFMCQHASLHTSEGHFCNLCKTTSQSCTCQVSISCPSCRTLNTMPKLLNLVYTNSECAVCSLSKAAVVFPKCKHANVCQDCCESWFQAS